jgi:16S rRNA (cytidine1402-2'-O)-methyltransferase
VEILGNDQAVGQLVVVATPLGNLGDLSRRALELFESADVIYCEDTRHSRTLFSANAIALRGRLQSLHEHNEASQCAHIVDRVRRGETVLLISDAGTPGISDPGSRVVAAVAEAGLVVTTAPGPSAVIAALSISGLPTERFCMEGFAPRKHGEREAVFDLWAREPRTIVFYESPQRLATTINELAERFPERRAAVVREMTKVHEEVIRGTLSEIAGDLNGRDILGEIVVVLDGVTPATLVDDETVRNALREQFENGVSLRDAVSSVAEVLGAAHRTAYQLALEVRAERSS